ALMRHPRWEIEATNSGCTSEAFRIRIALPMHRILNLLFRALGFAVAAAVFGFLGLASAQNSSPSQDLGNKETPANQHDPSKNPQVSPTHSSGNAEQASRTESPSSALVLGPGDEVDVTVYGAPDLSGHTRVSGDGNISMPLIGYIRVAGLSSSEAEG